MNTTTIRPLIDAFVTAMSIRYEEHVSQYTPAHLFAATHEVREGGRYLKVVRRVGGGGSVIAFVDMATGDIYKPASHRAPAKGIRANVKDADGGRSCLTDMGTICYWR